MNKITASWVGKAAYAMINNVGSDGKEANRVARALADELIRYGVRLNTVDPRVYALRHVGLAKNESFHLTADRLPDAEWLQVQRNIRNRWVPAGPHQPTLDDYMSDYLD